LKLVTFINFDEYTTKIIRQKGKGYIHTLNKIYNEIEIYNQNDFLSLFYLGYNMHTQKSSWMKNNEEYEIIENEFELYRILRSNEK